MDDPPIHFGWTRYGFEYGAAKVERAGSHKGHVVLTIRTAKQLLAVHVTPGGRIRLDIGIVKD